MMLDQKRVRHGERDFRVMLFGQFDRFKSGRPRRFVAEQVTLNVHVFRVRNVLRVNVVRAKCGRSAETGEHRPLGIIRDQHDARAGRIRRSGNVNRHARVSHVGEKELPQRVAPDFAGVRGCPSEIDDPHNRVRRRTARTTGETGGLKSTQHRLLRRLVD